MTANPSPEERARALVAKHRYDQYEGAPWVVKRLEENAEADIAAEIRAAVEAQRVRMLGLIAVTMCDLKFGECSCKAQGSLDEHYAGIQETNCEKASVLADALLEEQATRARSEKA